MQYNLESFKASKFQLLPVVIEDRFECPRVSVEEILVVDQWVGIHILQDGVVVVAFKG